jgi:sulfur transfer protein SufE/stress-induced morphogen
MKFSVAVVLLAWFEAAASSTAFVAPFTTQHVPAFSGTTRCMADTDVDTLGLTPELAKVTQAFESIGDDKLRYKQLLYMANQLEPIPESSQIPENKVPGCLSTVFVDGTAKYSDNGQDVLIYFRGDSDGLLTKGLVALLVRGLSGNTAESIQKIDPAFIQKAGIAASLTPGRNNGFLNMLATMKRKAAQLAQAGVDDTGTNGPTADENENDESSTPTPDAVSSTGRPMYDGIINALQKLQPGELRLVDNSQQHAGHAGAKGLDGDETHFDLYITSDAFDGLSLVKRHKLVYMMLGEIMPKIHAMQIKALTLAEADAKK